MSTAVAISAAPVDPSAARKRRREILASQRHQTLDVTAMAAAIATPVTSDDDDDDEPEHEPARKSRRVSDFAEQQQQVMEAVANVLPAPVMSASVRTITTTTKKKCTAKKPQMKYDPDVPMTKEEAAVWRREQRRKRNRESAALSRQKQRDRIGDLEVEVADWKNKVDSIMDRIKKLEEASGIDSKSLVPAVPEPMVVQAITSSINTSSTSNKSKFVSPPVSPGQSNLSLLPLEEASPVASSSIKSVVDMVVDHVLGGGNFGLEHSDKMISRHAAS
jgi:hypothetical protein